MAPAGSFVPREAVPPFPNALQEGSYISHCDPGDPQMLLSAPSDIRKTLGFKANGQERILEMSLMQKDDFIKAQEQNLGAERAALGS